MWVRGSPAAPVPWREIKPIFSGEMFRWERTWAILSAVLSSGQMMQTRFFLRLAPPISVRIASASCPTAIRSGHELATVVNDLMMASIDGSPVNGRTATNSV
jgi:hypothetical protein